MRDNYYKVIFVAAICLMPAFTEAQKLNSLLIKGTSAAYTIGQRQFEGSPFLNDDFVESAVIANKSMQGGVMTRYNIFEDYMEIYQDGSVYVLYPVMSINKIVMGNREFVVGRFEWKDKPHRGYLEVLDSGKVSLFAKHSVDHKDAEDPSPMKYQGAPERFVKNDNQYFYRIDSGELIKITKVKSFIEAQTKQKDALTDFVKKEKIGKDEADLKKLIQYYNSLLANEGS